MKCDICNKRQATLFVTVSQPQGAKVHIAKAHACTVCHEILVDLSTRDDTTVTEISQQEYNEMPENKP